MGLHLFSHYAWRQIEQPKEPKPDRQYDIVCRQIFVQKPYRFPPQLVAKGSPVDGLTSSIGNPIQRLGSSTASPYRPALQT